MSNENSKTVEPGVGVRGQVMPPELEVGDRIWYRRKGETYIHTNIVAEVRSGLIAVVSQRDWWPAEFGQNGRGWVRAGAHPAWLDRSEIEILDREAA